MNRKLTLLLLFAIGFPLACLAQVVKTITGTVTDEKGSPLPNVTITVQGKTASVLTDAQGKFTLANIREQDVIIVSMIGYTTQSVKITTDNQYPLKLVTNNLVMDDVVVIGYGEVKRKDLTGAVGSVNMKDMEKAPVPSFEDALAG
ncbi:MAG TPA: carboxypeptidase-like regulatory domain-containing protein, partial [Niabella sp.]|nr:carboxypeptidase-like regulatory domain-containing protein [Niabella sp.]